MSVKVAAAASILVGAFAPLPASANFKTGNDLYSECTARESSLTYYQEEASCLSYIIGAYDEFEVERQMADLPDCTPDRLTAGQVRDIVTKFIRENPAYRNLTAAALVRGALVRVWPACST